MKSLSDKRLIIEGELKGERYPFLIDTGAAVALIDRKQAKKLNLAKGSELQCTLVGAGGTIDSNYRCNELFSFNGTKIGQFVISDIDDVVDSIKRQTGIKILGLLSLPQMKMLGMTIDTIRGEINFKNIV